MEEQQRNRGAYNNRITAFGVTRTLSEWCAIYDRWPNTIKHRLALGWSTEDAVSMDEIAPALRGNGRWRMV